METQETDGAVAEEPRAKPDGRSYTAADLRSARARFLGRCAGRLGISPIDNATTRSLIDQFLDELEAVRGSRGRK